MMNLIRLAALVLALSTFVTAQTTRPKQGKQSDPELEQRRATALSLLNSLAIEARSYTDEPLRARIQAQIADVIWNHDKEAARALFRRAWAIAEVLDLAASSSNSSSNSPGQRPNGSGRRPPRTYLRREILSLASRRDHALGEEFLAKMTPREGDDSNSAGRELSSAESVERLRLASELLEDNNIERALQFADPALTRVGSSSIEFLIQLRAKHAAAADLRFASLLRLAGADPASDANTVSLLTSYAFTPSIYLVVSRSGIPSSNSYPQRDAPQLHPQLRRAFFEVAAGILLRPLSQIDQSTAGRAGTHFMTTRVLPLFQQFAPDLVGPLNAQLAALGPEAAKATANIGEVSLKRGMGDGGDSKSDELAQRLDRAKNSDERDRAYAFAAIHSAEDADSGAARDYAEKIEDADTRKGVTTYVDYMLIRAVLKQKRADEALLLIRKVELPRILRTHFLTQVATLKLKDDPVRATEILNEALTEARRLDQGTGEKAYAFVGLLRPFSVLDRTRAWELLNETIKTANSAADFTGERGEASLTLEGKFSIRLSIELASATDLADVFREVAQQNFYQALDLAKTFRADAPRALATIAVARAVLDDTRR